jgi:glycosyltransferase involved in cell wall biosynthesis
MKIAILHYSVPPVVGGVEAVIQAHTELLLNAGFQVHLIAGAGDQAALPNGVDFTSIPEMSSQHPRVVDINQQLESGCVPPEFEGLSSELETALQPVLASFDCVIVHNIFTKHFNLPLTAALARLLDQAKIRHCIAWCHDFTWTSSHSRDKVRSGYPWDLLRMYRGDMTYVTISGQRQAELAGLYQCPAQQIRVINNGVDLADIYSLSTEGQKLVERLGVIESDLALLMPVRITQAKNIELAMRVVASLKRSHLHPRLVITGPPDPHAPAELKYYQSLLDLRRKLQLENEARFVYELGPVPGEGYTIGMPIVYELYRVCDLLFMPSHREGYGMPILEAGVSGMPIFTTQIPAAIEIGQRDVRLFSQDDPPEKVAELILRWAHSNLTHGLRVRVRQNYTWQAIFRHQILPVLHGDKLV